MPKAIDDFYILTESGTVLFNDSMVNMMETQGFGMIMSSINMFAKQVITGGLSKFELGDKRFNLMKENDLIFCASSSVKIKEKKVNSYLKAISEKFFKLYPKEFIQKWNGDISCFEIFQAEYNKF